MSEPATITCPKCLGWKWAGPWKPGTPCGTCKGAGRVRDTSVKRETDGAGR